MKIQLPSISKFIHFAVLIGLILFNPYFETRIESTYGLPDFWTFSKIEWICYAAVLVCYLFCAYNLSSFGPFRSIWLSQYLLLLMFYSSAIQIWLNAQFQKDEPLQAYECKISSMTQRKSAINFIYKEYELAFEACSNGAYLSRQKVSAEVYKKFEPGVPVKITTRQGGWMPVVVSYSPI